MTPRNQKSSLCVQMDEQSSVLTWPGVCSAAQSVTLALELVMRDAYVRV